MTELVPGWVDCTRSHGQAQRRMATLARMWNRVGRATSENVGDQIELRGDGGSSAGGQG